METMERGNAVMLKDTQFQEATYEEWLQVAKAQLKGKPIEKLFKETYEGLTIEPLYDESHLDQSFSHPGVVPFTRGTNSENGWNIAQLIEWNQAHELNERLLQAMNRGQNTLHFSVKEITDLHQLETIFQQIDIEQLTLFLDARENRAFLPLFIHYCEEKGISFQNIKGSIAVNPFYELTQYGRDESFKEATQFLASLISWAKAHRLSTRLILLKGTEFHEAGAHNVQELTYTFLQAIEILEALTDKGLTVDEIALYMQFSFSIGSDFFMEIAKLRAAKHIWATIVAAYGGSEESQKLSLHAQTSEWNKSKLDIHVNLLRTTSEAFSAVIGGVDYLTIAPFDQLSDSSELGERIARNIHFILQEESFLHKVQDPAGGSYFIDTLTKQLTEKVWENIQQNEKAGGFLVQFMNGVVQDEIEKTYEVKRKDLEERKKLLIGTNVYANLEDHMTDDAPKALEKSVSIVETDVETCLSIIRSNHGSIQSLCEIEPLAEPKVRPLQKRRWAEPFEEMRKRALRYKEQQGHFPEIAVIPIGLLKDYKPRLDFLRGLMATGGVMAKEYSLEDKIEHAIVVLCGADDDYKLLTKDDVQRLKETGRLWVVGQVSEGWNEKGEIDKFIHAKLNVLQLLEEVHQLLGVEGE